MDASTALRMTVTMATNGTGAALANFGGPNTMIKGDTQHLAGRGRLTGTLRRLSRCCSPLYG